MASPSDPTPVSVIVRSDHVALQGDLTIPMNPFGIIVFAHGSGSGRLSPRNQQVARSLVRAGFATLLFDLLTVHEEAAERYTRHLRFDIGLLGDRLTGTLGWLARQPSIRDLPIGVFGASTGAAAALVAASRVPAVRAVVSRGGRPDLANSVLPKVRCPTLLIVGGDDVEVIELNRRALHRMTANARLHIVPRATHLFEEPGALEEVTSLAASWFHEHLVQPGREEQPPA
jgi:dienelactone hydrolase